MKKSILFFAVILFVACTACSKKPENNSSQPIEPHLYPWYAISGLFNITLKKGTDTTITMPLIITNKGSAIGITLTPDSLPATVTVTPSSVTGQNSFTASFIFHFNAIDTGTFPINIATWPPSVDDSVYKFHLIVD